MSWARINSKLEASSGKENRDNPSQDYRQLLLIAILLGMLKPVRAQDLTSQPLSTKEAIVLGIALAGSVILLLAFCAYSIWHHTRTIKLPARTEELENLLQRDRAEELLHGDNLPSQGVPEEKDDFDNIRGACYKQ